MRQCTVIYPDVEMFSLLFVRVRPESDQVTFNVFFCNRLSTSDVREILRLS